MEPTAFQHQLAALLDRVPQEKRKELRFSYVPLGTDVVLRWLVLGLWDIGLTPLWLFAVLQVGLIPVAVLVGLVMRDEARAKLYPGYILSLRTSFWSGLFAWIVILSGSIIVHVITADLTRFWRYAATSGTFLVYGFYVLAVYLDSYSTEPPRVKRNLFPNPDSTLEIADPADRNDIQIVGMETEVLSMSQRVEAYTLESTLFGALAFSGFLTLLSAERELIAPLKAVTEAWLREFRPDTWINTGITFEQALGIIAVETLICSMFFLAVVLSRLRFYSMLHQVQYAVQVARAWNHKEEEVRNIRLQIESVESAERLSNYSKLVTHAIHHAVPLMADLNGITRYISVFRNLGVFSFLVVLFTSAFVMSLRLGFVFITIGTAAFLYSSVDHWIRHRKLRDVDFFRRLTRSR